MRLGNAVDPERVEDRRHGAGGLQMFERARARPIPDAAVSGLRDTRHSLAVRRGRPSTVPLRAVWEGVRAAALSSRADRQRTVTLTNLAGPNLPVTVEYANTARSYVPGARPSTVMPYPELR